VSLSCAPITDSLFGKKKTQVSKPFSTSTCIMFPNAAHSRPFAFHWLGQSQTQFMRRTKRRGRNGLKKIKIKTTSHEQKENEGRKRKEEKKNRLGETEDGGIAYLVRCRISMNSSKYRLFPSLVNLYHSLHIPLRKIVNQSSMFFPGGILDPEISVSELLFLFLENVAVGRHSPLCSKQSQKEGQWKEWWKRGEAS